MLRKQCQKAFRILAEPALPGGQVHEEVQGIRALDGCDPGVVGELALGILAKPRAQPPKYFLNLRAPPEAYTGRGSDPRISSSMTLGKNKTTTKGIINFSCCRRKAQICLKGNHVSQSRISSSLSPNASLRSPCQKIRT